MLSYFFFFFMEKVSLSGIRSKILGSFAHKSCVIRVNLAIIDHTYRVCPPFTSGVSVFDIWLTIQ